MPAETKDKAGIVRALGLMANAATRRLDLMFPGHFATAKHNHYRDFGWPETLAFPQLYDMWRRNSVAQAAVRKTARKCWQDHPWLREREEEHEETKIEAEIRQRFGDLRVWQRLAEADRRSMVGGYAGAILRVADSKRFDQPVDSVPGGIEGLAEVIPAWAGQLTVSEWDEDQTSETYGQPRLFQFNEASVGSDRKRNRAFNVHPDRVIVWSDDGTVHGRSMLEAGYNDLMDMEKIRGAGGEGFWKNAKSAPVVEVDKEATIREMAAAMGVPEAEVVDAMNDQVENWQQGFDKLLMGQGMKFSTLGVTLPIPEHFFGIAIQSFAASIEMPTKILVGMQTGERASTEDAREWSQTCMGRRSDSVIPNVLEFVNRLERFGILPERDWFLQWDDLTEATADEKIARVEKMAGVNSKTPAEWVFTSDELREVVGYEPLTDADKYRDDLDVSDEEAGLPDEENGDADQDQ